MYINARQKSKNCSSYDEVLKQKLARPSSRHGIAPGIASSICFLVRALVQSRRDGQVSGAGTWRYWTSVSPRFPRRQNDIH